MRQIAGGSKAGLRRFLSQYPALFKIENDQVSIAQIVCNTRANSNSPSDQNDYGYEAMMYFKEKLKQYGEGIEVPIKSLLGHRSQAKAEVRHFSGQHINDFREFLLKYQDHFVVTEETIYLKEYEGTVMQMYSESTKVNNQSEDKGSDDNLNGEILSQSKLQVDKSNRKLLELMKTILADSDLEIEDLLEIILDEFCSGVDDDENVALPFKNETNLRAFLRIYPSTFTLQGRRVGLANKKSSNPSSPSRTISKTNESSSSRQSLSLRDRVSSVLKKAVADNSTRNNNNVFSDYKSRLDTVQVMTEFNESKVLVNKLIATENYLAVEVKGANLGPEGTISSVHIGTADGKVYIFDTFQLPEVFMSGL